MIAHFDTEFQDNPLALASIGVIRQDGETFYRVSEEFQPDPRNWWFMRNVWKKIKHEPKTPTAIIAQELQVFLDGVQIMAVRGGGHHCDEKLLRMLGCEHPILDIEVLWREAGKPALPKFTKAHSALEDAKLYREIHNFIATVPSSFEIGRTVELTSKHRKKIRRGSLYDFTKNVAWATQAGVWARKNKQNQWQQMVSQSTTADCFTTAECATSGVTNS